MVRRIVLLAGLAALAAGTLSPARGQTSLGGQRVATSSGSFLKIGLDARAAGLGGAYTALAEGPMAAFYNPACLSGLRGAQASFAYARWPAEINIAGLSLARPWGESGAAFGVSIEYLGTTLDETTEYHPTGTGRTFAYSDMLIGFTASRPFSDRLSFGGTVKFVREDLGSGIGGPVANSWMVDAGTLYRIGALDGRLAIALLHFGPDIQPAGTFVSHLTGAETDYASFSPPTTFRLGLSLEPYRRGAHSLVSASEVVHVADNAEAFRTGLEYTYETRYVARAGFDGGADAAKFSAGLGVRLAMRGSETRIDYAYTDGGPLLAIHRWSVVVPL
ncbi:MAG: PorV/PorQ family protein [Candidatus Eisenbacteria bacterium]|nr:PorV/PorQ family protein [Candidatus Eisenbacteria bacterium]